MYILNMASLQKKISHGRPYWYIVECRRIKGKPRPMVLAYLGSTERLLNRLLKGERVGSLKVKSYSHGAVYGLWQVASEIGLLAILNQYLPVQKRDGLSVAETLLLAAIYRAIRPGSKRSFSEWVCETTLPFLANFSSKNLTSQHFWDQMDVVSEEALAGIEEVLAKKLVADLGFSLDTLFYDTTNFFTYVNTGNERSKLCQRGYNKQKRIDLRQFNLALLVSREAFIPLFSLVYEGNIPDNKSFPEILSRLRHRLEAINQRLEDLTLVFDKGNYSAVVQDDLERLSIHWVGSLSSVHYQDLLGVPIKKFYKVELSNGDEVFAYRCVRKVFGKEMTVVMVLSEKLKDGQLRGFSRALDRALKGLTELKNALQGVRCRYRKEGVLKKVNNFLAREYLKEVIKVEVKERGEQVSISYKVNDKRCDYLKQEIFGKKILFTDRRDWSEREIIEAYYGLGRIEQTFRHLKNPYHFTVRPQYHWTDQKVKVHTFCCLLGLLLGGLVHWKVRRAGIKISLEHLLEKLNRIREAVIIEPTGGRGKPRVRRQLEEIPDEIKRLYEIIQFSIYKPETHKC
ncbi:MAG: IS1634 family transposase [bacterium]